MNAVTIEGNVRGRMTVKAGRGTSEAIANGLANEIERIQTAVRYGGEGLPPVCSVVLDGASCNVRAVRLLSDRLFVFGHLCQAHGFSKVAEKIASMPAFADYIDKAHQDHQEDQEQRFPRSCVGRGPD